MKQIHWKKKLFFGGAGMVRTILLGFLGVIAVGSILLALPCASATGQSIGWFDGLFTSTSAVCVTGLVVRDTATTFSLFGQIVLLLLIQIGGLGFTTFAILSVRLIGRRFSLRERMLIQESMNAESLEGMDALLRWVVASAFCIELAGAALLAVRLVPEFGNRGYFMALFHAVSAFCNAGFDLFGQYISLTRYQSDGFMNLCIMALIVIGGLGFGTVRDLIHAPKRKFLQRQTRVVLITYGALFLLGWGFTLLAEWHNPETLGTLSVKDKLLTAAFQSVTLRTAGFNTLNEQALTPIAKLISCILMFVGAAPASTGGGIKVTTLALMVLSVTATMQGKASVSLFHRKMPDSLIKRAFAVCAIALTIVTLDMTVISLLQPELGFMDIAMECASAMGTVGLSAFGSASLCGISRVMIICTMFFGRVGPLSIAIALANRKSNTRISYPEGHIMIG